MRRRPPRSTRTDTLFPYTTLFRSRQEAHIELIASENYCSPAVMEAQGSQLTIKYAEGYPGKRYYGGCEFVDIAEQLAIDRIKQVFDCDYANVQPHSGAQANAAIFLALVSPGDTVMGMNLAQGGHLTHGNPANFSGKQYKIVPYGLDTDTGLIDYRSEEHTSELQSLMRCTYAVFCLKKKNNTKQEN